MEANLYQRPGYISNRQLLVEDIGHDLGNMTPELDLKENLLEHHDFEALDRKVFDVLVKWYSIDFEICRVLRPDPFRHRKLFLDLYPG